MSHIISKKIKVFGKFLPNFEKDIINMAQTLGLVGYIKKIGINEAEVVAVGENLPITNMVNFCKQGSGLTKLDRVVIEDFSGLVFKDFKLKK